MWGPLVTPTKLIIIVNHRQSASSLIAASLSPSLGQRRCRCTNCEKILIHYWVAVISLTDSLLQSVVSRDRPTYTSSPTSRVRCSLNHISWSQIRWRQSTIWQFCCSLRVSFLSCARLEQCRSTFEPAMSYCVHGFIKAVRILLRYSSLCK